MEKAREPFSEKVRGHFNGKEWTFNEKRKLENCWKPREPYNRKGRDSLSVQVREYLMEKKVNHWGHLMEMQGKIFVNKNNINGKVENSGEKVRGFNGRVEEF